MSDRYQSLIHTPVGQMLAKNLGLPNPVELERYEEGQPLVQGTVVVGGSGRLGKALTLALDEAALKAAVEGFVTAGDVGIITEMVNGRATLGKDAADVVLFDAANLVFIRDGLLQNSPERADGHRIAVDVPPEAVQFQADEGQIRQIVWNLATNGVRAMPEGGRLTLRAHRGGAPGQDEVTLEVRDEGTGIAAEDIETIFHPFRTGFGRGTGLGLSIVQRIVAEQTYGDSWTAQMLLLADYHNVEAQVPDFAAQYTEVPPISWRHQL